ncbi:MAG: hypothetical protein ACJA06_001816 [Halocynthiibacter sp.]|jgi:hypothetical protein
MLNIQTMAAFWVHCQNFGLITGLNGANVGRSVLIVALFGANPATFRGTAKALRDSHQGFGARAAPKQKGRKADAPAALFGKRNLGIVLLSGAYARAVFGVFSACAARAA